MTKFTSSYILIPFISLFVLNSFHIECTKRKLAPFENEEGNNKKPKQIQRSQSLPKQDTKSIFNSTHKEVIALRDKFYETRKRLKKKLDRINLRSSPNSYAPLDAKNRDDLKNHYEKAEDEKETAEEWKRTAQALLYKSKQLERVNKNRKESGKEPFKTIPNRISNFENASKLMMEYSLSHKKTSEEARNLYEEANQKHLCSIEGRFPCKGYSENVHKNYLQDLHDYRSTKAEIQKAHDDYKSVLDKNKKYFYLEKQQSGQKRAKSVG